MDGDTPLRTQHLVYDGSDTPLQYGGGDTPLQYDGDTPLQYEGDTPLRSQHWLTSEHFLRDKDFNLYTFFYIKHI